jgi:hypothetical protein
MPLNPNCWCSRGKCPWVAHPNKPRPKKASKSKWMRGVNGLMHGIAATEIIIGMDINANTEKDNE